MIYMTIPWCHSVASEWSTVAGGWAGGAVVLWHGEFHLNTSSALFRSRAILRL